jgi:enamine deaminase RidA (YjgF/YER057c/UK114 family)
MLMLRTLHTPRPRRRVIEVPGLDRDVPYDYAAIAGDLVFTAGACPLDGDGAVVAPGDIAEQARVATENLLAALGEAGADPAHVVKTTVYVASSERSDLVAAWDVIAAAFAPHRPPSTLLGVAVLGYPGQLVEIEAIAAREPS